MSYVKAQVTRKADGVRKTGDVGSSTEEKPVIMVDDAPSGSNWNETTEYRFIFSQE